jgi:hypothetical protein
MPEEVLAHPRHQAAQQTLADLILQLRRCGSLKEGYEFQQELLKHRLAVDEDRLAFRGAARRVRARKQPLRGTPPLQTFAVETSGPALADALTDAGIQSEWVRDPRPGPLAPGEVLMEMRNEEEIPMPDGKAIVLSRTLQMKPSEIDRYLLELIDQDTWIEGIRYLLSDPRMKHRPWPHYQGEEKVWL